MLRKVKLLQISSRKLQLKQFHTVANDSNTTKIDQDFALKTAHIEEAIKLKPSLASINPELWRRAHETFANHGIQTTNFLRVAVANPNVITRAPAKLIHSLELWRSCQFGEKFMHLLITKYPELLDIDEHTRFLSHIAFLKECVGTNRRVWKMLMNSPNLVQQSEKCVAEKFAYIKEEMRIDVSEITKSEALSKSLEEIRIRHVFLVRLGLFKARPPKANHDEPSKNHRLYQITDTSDKTFATRICHVRLEEFEAFQELYRRELRQSYQEWDMDNDDNEEFSDDVKDEVIHR